MSTPCCNLPQMEPAAGGRRVVLAGNPNVGKSVLFHALTGIYTEVANYPGTTVDVATGRLGRDSVTDTPGIYGVSGFTDEERVARDVILAADLVVNVVDAVHLARDLFLTLQLLDLGLPVVVALNLVDEAARNGLAVDAGALASALGVPVVPTVAVQGRGLAQLKAAMVRAARGQVVNLRSPAERLDFEEADREMVYLDRRARVDALVSQVVRQTNRGAGPGIILGRLAVHPLWGLPILAGVLWALYQVVGVAVAQHVVDFTENTLMVERYEPWVRGQVAGAVPWAWARDMLVGEFGVLTMTVTYLLGLLLPLVLAFYLAMSVLEDSGYLPRVAVLADRGLTWVGLNGRAVIPMILGFGCVTMATVTTRILGSRRERTIATFLLALAVPCSAQIAVIATMVSPLGPGYLALYILVVLLVFGLVGAGLNRLLPGRSTDLLLDLPPLRVPRLANVLRKTGQKSWMFLSEAGPIFAAGALVISVLQLSGVLAAIQGLLRPLTAGWLGLPPETATAFVMGFVRRDFGAAGLYTMDLTPGQTLVALITITLFVPCIAALMMVVKERGRQQGALIWLGTVALAFLVGGLAYRLLPL